MLNPFANRKLLRRGETVRARIVEMSTRVHGAEPSKVSMTLEIDFRGAPYEVSDRWMISGTEPINTGSEIWVAVDPENRHRVAIDWDRTRADYRKRTDVRRRVLASGVPVPVTKLREALEQAGELGSGAERVVEPAEPVEPADDPFEVLVEEEEDAAVPEPAEHESVLALGVASPPRPIADMSLHERELLGEHPSLPVAELAHAISPPVVAPRRWESKPFESKRSAKPKPFGPAIPPPGPVAPTSTAFGAPPVPASDEDDLTSRLERLAALRVAGVLTEGEFSAAKAHVLATG